MTVWLRTLIDGDCVNCGSDPCDDSGGGWIPPAPADCWSDCGSPLPSQYTCTIAGGTGVYAGAYLLEADTVYCECSWHHYQVSPHLHIVLYYRTGTAGGDRWFCMFEILGALLCHIQWSLVAGPCAPAGAYIGEVGTGGLCNPYSAFPYPCGGSSIGTSVVIS